MVEGLRDAFEYVTGLKEKAMEPIVTEIEGKTYCNQSCEPERGEIVFWSSERKTP